ncbi:hypothetical protein CR203_15175 [Salipaludibacillus neizhouensis]|uniref:Uncharacterized protein n=2 Tax=Salipaludibacillus neizhouensis TaxID=885475 RepID=A0A3A9K0K0_9BACI|nr:hypothetical protein CR203_15175 [Salipaludibacillus neizhouensis]
MAVIFEPMTVWLEIYNLDNWRYIYSFPIYIIKAVVIKWLVDEFILKKASRDGSLLHLFHGHIHW